MRILNQTVFILILFTLACSSQPNSRQPRDNQSESTSIPKMYALVNDYANVLTNEEESELTSLIKSLEDSVGSQLGILTVNSLDGKSIEQYSIEVANNWRIGRENYDDGILIVLAKSDRKIRIEVGYGLELIIRDEIAKKIIDSTIIPEFRAKSFAQGLYRGSEQIIEKVLSNRDMIGKKWKAEASD